MRTVTVTEKYNAVLEGRMAKREFIRQMRQQYPMFVSQYNGFADTVQILKNKGMLFEAQLPPVYDERPKANVPLDVLDRAIRRELTTMGFVTPDGVTRVDYMKAKKKAEANLEKDPLYYVNKVSGESSKIDKHDKCEPVKRGEPAKDTFNGMKKATLKEGVETGNMLSLEDIKKIAFKAGQQNPAAKTAILNNQLLYGSDDVPEDIIRELLTKYNISPESVGLPNDSAPSEAEDAPVAENSKSSTLGELKRRIQADSNANYSEELFDEYVKELAENLRNGQKDRYKGWKISDYLNDFETFAGRSGLKEDDELNFQAAKVSGDKTGSKFTLEGQLLERKKKSEKKLTESQKNQVKSAIKKMIMEAITRKPLMEAATADLSSYAERHSDVEGLGEIVNSLENIVTEVESFYNKVNGKIQDTFDKLGDLKDSEERSIGALLAPGLKRSFMEDLDPVMNKFPGNYKIPEENAAPEAGLDEFAEEEPKKTVFAPATDHEL